MKLYTTICLFLLAFVGTSFVEVRPLKTAKKPRFPRIVERILSKKIIANHHLLTEKRAEIMEQMQAEDRLRDPVKKWLWLAVISFGMGVLLMSAAIILQKAQGTTSPDVNDSCLTVLIAFIGVLSLMFSIVAIVIWWVKMNAN